MISISEVRERMKMEVDRLISQRMPVTTTALAEAVLAGMDRLSQTPQDVRKYALDGLKRVAQQVCQGKNYPTADDEAQPELFSEDDDLSTTLQQMYSLRRDGIHQYVERLKLTASERRAISDKLGKQTEAYARHREEFDKETRALAADRILPDEVASAA